MKNLVIFLFSLSVILIASCGGSSTAIKQVIARQKIIDSTTGKARWDTVKVKEEYKTGIKSSRIFSDPRRDARANATVTDAQTRSRAVDYQGNALQTKIEAKAYKIIKEADGLKNVLDATANRINSEAAINYSYANNSVASRAPAIIPQDKGTHKVAIISNAKNPISVTVFLYNGEPTKTYLIYPGVPYVFYTKSNRQIKFSYYLEGKKVEKWKKYVPGISGDIYRILQGNDYITENCDIKLKIQ